MSGAEKEAVAAKAAAGFWRVGPLQSPVAFHPLLASLPILLDYVYDNRNMAWPAMLLPAIFVTLLVSLPLWAALSALTRNPRVGAVIVTAIVLGFYGHHDADRWAPWMWGGIGLMSVVMLAWRPNAAVATTFLNLFAVLGTLPGAYKLVRAYTAEHQPQAVDGYLDALPIHPRPGDAPPDVWYIVLDGYGRSDVLHDLYEYDNPLPAYLREKGFYVADKAVANYAQTGLSFSSALNVDYVQNLITDSDSKSTWRNPLGELVGTNRVITAFDRAGYRIVQYPGEYSVTALDHPDEVRKPFFTFSEFEYILVGKTPIFDISDALGFTQSRMSHAIRRRHISWVLDDLEKGDRWDGPTFVFAHIVAPHPPFIFQPDGEYRSSLHTATFADGSGWKSRAKKYGEKYEPGYRDQVEYLNRRLVTIVDRILETSDRPPVIVIAGDHGPGGHLDWSSQANSDMRERMAILSAVHFPDPAGYAALYPTITPINTWRVVLDEVLDARLPLLADKSWFNLWSRPYKFSEVTDELSGKVKPQKPPKPKQVPRKPKPIAPRN